MASNQTTSHGRGHYLENPSEALDFHHRGVKNYSLEESPPPPLRRRVLVPAKARERDMHGPHYEGYPRLKASGGQVLRTMT